MAEYISNDPPTAAIHAESDGFEINCTCRAKIKFLGQCIELKLDGYNSIKLKKHNEVYLFNRPINSFKIGLDGQYYLETIGDMKIRNDKLGNIANVDFIKPNIGDKRVNLIEGTINNQEGQQEYSILGKWDEEISVIAYETNKMK